MLSLLTRSGHVPLGEVFGSKLGQDFWDTLHKADYVHLVCMVTHYNWTWRVQMVAKRKGGPWETVDYNPAAQWGSMHCTASEQSQSLLDSDLSPGSVQ